MRLFTACILSILFPSLFLSGTDHPVIFPADNAVVNYTTIYFEETFERGGKTYEFHLYLDSVSASGNLPKLKRSAAIPAFKVEDLQWGQSYFWKVNIYDNSSQLIRTGSLHRFRLMERVNSVHFNEIKIDVLKNKTDRHLGGLICIDYAKMICDRSGKAVWVMPEIPGLQNRNSQIRDLKVTADQSLTFLTNNVPLETDWDGNILWSLPNPFVFGQDTIIFHHEFEKLDAEHYYVLGNKKVRRRVLGNFSNDEEISRYGLITIRDTLYKITDIAILFEFDRQGKVRWFWDANNYITDADLNYKKTPAGFPILLTHANGFDVNKENTKVYVSFRDLSRIVRVNKKTKTVEQSYGEKYPSGEAKWANGLFEAQHDPNITSRNSILILNNNGARSKKVSSIVEFAINPRTADEPPIWKFDLNFDTLTDGKSPSGGNVVEMENSNVLLCGGQLNRIFEVTRNKDLVWDAFLYSKAQHDSTWQLFPQYRASWVKNIDQQHFIFNLHQYSKFDDKKMDLSLTLYNTGEEADFYLITIENKNGDIFYRKFTRIINNNSSLQQNLKLTLNPSQTGPLILTVRSVKNSSKAKNSTLKFE